MRLAHLFAGMALGILCGPTLADTPQVELRAMIERDIAGDPSGRLNLAAADAVVVVPASRQIERARIAFELDADAMELATSWRFDEHQAKCSPVVCSIRVIYRVVGTTAGTGVPSWSGGQGREIRALPKAIERRVQYSFANVDGAWKLEKLPVPFVAPNVLTEFFEREMKLANANPTPAAVDERASRNREVVRAWRLRQLDTLSKLPH